MQKNEAPAADSASLNTAVQTATETLAKLTDLQNRLADVETREAQLNLARVEAATLQVDITTRRGSLRDLEASVGRLTEEVRQLEMKKAALVQDIRDHKQNIEMIRNDAESVRKSKDALDNRIAEAMQLLRAPL